MQPQDLGTKIFKNAAGNYSVVREELVYESDLAGREISTKLLKTGTVQECLEFVDQL